MNESGKSNARILHPVLVARRPETSCSHLGTHAPMTERCYNAGHNGRVSKNDSDPFTLKIPAIGHVTPMWRSTFVLQFADGAYPAEAKADRRT